MSVECMPCALPKNFQTQQASERYNWLSDGSRNRALLSWLLVVINSCFEGPQLGFCGWGMSCTRLFIDISDLLVGWKSHIGHRAWLSTQESPDINQADEIFCAERFRFPRRVQSRQLHDSGKLAKELRESVVSWDWCHTVR